MKLATVPKSMFSERPLQLRPVEEQFFALGYGAGASPLEAGFAHALIELLTDPREFGPPAYSNLLLPIGAISGLLEFPPIRKARLEGTINAMPQCKIGAYVADFAFVVKAYGRKTAVVKGIVECDGHSYHERTKEQAAYDRRRDRFMQELDIAVLRFPGFEIHDNPKTCAREAVNVLIRRSILRGGK